MGASTVWMNFDKTVARSQLESMRIMENYSCETDGKCDEVISIMCRTLCDSEHGRRLIDIWGRYESDMESFARGWVSQEPCLNTAIEAARSVGQSNG